MVFMVCECYELGVLVEWYGATFVQVLPYPQKIQYGIPCIGTQASVIRSQHYTIELLWYKVVQIWPGHMRLVYTEISPGHIWTTLY